MFNLFIIIITQISTGLAIAYSYAAWNWMYAESGVMLNPMIAFPIATLAVIIPWYGVKYLGK